MTPGLVAEPGAVTAEWLTEVLHGAGAIAEDTAVTSCCPTPIGTGQVGDNVRYAIEYDGPPGPASVVCKFGSRDPVSAATGVQLHLYETEVAFYRQLAHTVDVACPRCFFAAVEHGTANSVVVMEDVSPAEQGDQIIGCTVEQAQLAVDQAARLHGPRWADPTLAELEWLDRTALNDGLVAVLPVVWESFVERYRSALDLVTLEIGPELGELVSIVNGLRPSCRTVLHGDFRLDNMLFATAGGRPLTIVDWQTLQLGPGPRDVAYFLGNALDPEARRSTERDLVEQYHRALVTDYGVEDYPFDQCWAEYVASSYTSLVMAVFGSMLVGRTDRGDAMFMTMANRSAQMGSDLDAPSLIRSS